MGFPTLFLFFSSGVTFIHAFFPLFCAYDGLMVKKHLIPIEPKFHDRLFPDVNIGGRQISLFGPNIKSEGNSIKKAYICNSNSHKINIGDIIIFYRSQDIQALTTIGTVESIYYDLNDPEMIAKIIAKRTTDKGLISKVYKQLI